MGELVASVVLIAVVVAIWAVIIRLAGRSERKQHKRTVAAQRAAKWEVGEAGYGEPGSWGGVYVFIRKVTADGTEVDWATVAEVRNGDPDWDALMADARANAASRAALLNTNP